MAIEPNPKPETSPEDQAVLREVYENQLRDLSPQLDAAKLELANVEVVLTEYRARHAKALREYALLQGHADALKMVAARDGITLD